MMLNTPNFGQPVQPAPRALDAPVSGNIPHNVTTNYNLGYNGNNGQQPQVNQYYADDLQGYDRGYQDPRHGQNIWQSGASKPYSRGVDLTRVIYCPHTVVPASAT